MRERPSTSKWQSLSQDAAAPAGAPTAVCHPGSPCGRPSRTQERMDRRQSVETGSSGGRRQQAPVSCRATSWCWRANELTRFSTHHFVWIAADGALKVGYSALENFSPIKVPQRLPRVRVPIHRLQAP